jgi:hypothetical protein
MVMESGSCKKSDFARSGSVFGEGHVWLKLGISQIYNKRKLLVSDWSAKISSRFDDLQTGSWGSFQLFESKRKCSLVKVGFT